MNTSQMFRSKMGQTSMMDKSIMSSRQNLNTSQIDKSGQGKMDFEHFLKFLEICAEKVFPQLDISDAF